MSDRLIRYRILDAVPAEGRIERGFHRLGLLLGMPLVVIGLLVLPVAIWSGALEVYFWPTIAVAIGGLLITLCNTLGWVASGFFGH